MSPFDESGKKPELTPEQLDNKPIWFGKFKGKTPTWIAEEGDKGDSYVRWAYETVSHSSRPVFCSEALYKACGGKGKSALAQAEAKALAERKKPNSYRPAVDDDDIPF